MSENKVFVLGVGAAKSGTTWLHRYISRYPEVDTGIVKEYRIWDALYIDTPQCRNYRLDSINLIRNIKHAVMRKSGVKKILAFFIKQSMQRNSERYFAYFEKLLSQKGIRITADITPSYMTLPSEVFDRIFNEFKKRGVSCKVILIMRDPLERCWSKVRMVKERSRSRALRQRSDDELLREYCQTSDAEVRTRYDIAITELEKAIPKENIHYAIYEELFSEKEIKRISHFIGLEPDMDFVSQRVKRHTKGETLSEETMSFVVNRFRGVYDFCAERFPQTVELWASRRFLQ